MENEFQRLISQLSITPSVENNFQRISQYLKQQTTATLSAFISDSLPSLINLENWAWNILSQDFYKFIDEPDYLDLFHTLGSFNCMIVFKKADLDTSIKASLLITDNAQHIDKICDQIETIQNDNDPFITVVSRWFENISYLIHEHTQFEKLPVIFHLWQRIGQSFLLSNQYKEYITRLCQQDTTQSIFTAKELFYIKTCSFVSRMFICSMLDKSPFRGEDLLSRYGHDYLQIISIHSQNVDDWNPHLLTCITHLIDFICACCWWGTEKAIHIGILLSSEQIIYDHIQALLRIVDNKSLYEKISSQWYNDETILIDSILIFIIGAILQIKNLTYFIRTETNLANILLTVAQKSCYDRISVCAYGILAEILSDEQLKEVKIADNISEFFFRILELAWTHPTQRYKRIPILQLLSGFLTVAKNDAIQQKTADSNKTGLLIEMSDKYPITLDILWSLSFNDDIKKQLRANRSFMNKLARLKEECNNEKMRKIIFGILWNLELNHIDRNISDTTMFDIMISYSHKDEAICQEIYQGLIEAGFRVWIDFDQIHGNVMDAMAQAIERSHTILICMSEQYRRSNYCRAEAHYAFQRQLKIVPILLQKHYKPDGWLLFLIGQLLYVDFTKYEFSRAMELLVAEVKAPDVQNDNVTSLKPKSDASVVSPTSTASLKLSQNMLEWSIEDVQKWLIGSNLRQMARLLNDFDGPSLNSLSELIAKSDPQRILTLFQDDALRKLNESISISELARFRTLLKEQQRFIKIFRPIKESHSNIFSLLTHCRIM